MIEIKDLTKIYKAKKGSSTTALNGIDLKINDKGMVFIVGTSGSGKSTLLNIIGGLDAADSGSIMINGTDISHLKKNEYASYRNTYVGFIFQEFNVLENLTVFENIEISLKLQNVQDTNSEIDDILKKLKMDDLKNRRMNELSGGQKQRVAIARALIKKPNIILADEPTGNLDSTNTKQIFDILKEISKDYLVIVVSHDKEAALKYADHTIQLEDGKVVSDDYKEEKNKEDKINFINSKLPNFYKFKLALTNLKTKPFKLIITIILLSMAFAFMEFTINMALFNKNLFLVNTMKDNKNYNYRIYKVEEFGRGGNSILSFEKSDFEKIKNITNKEVNLAYTFFDNGKEVEFEFGKFEEKSAYFSSQLQYITFIELKDDNLIENNIIGSIPKSSNEILVHKYFADYMIEFGIKLYDDTIYKPNNYNDIISDKKELKLGSNKLIISGIIDDDNKNYLKYKNKTRIYEDDEDYKNYSFYKNSYVGLSSTIYVRGLTDNITLSIDKNNIKNDIYLAHGIEGDKTLFLDKNIEILTKDGKKNISSLEKNELVISYSDLPKISDKYKDELNKYLESHKNQSYEKSVIDFTNEYLKSNSINYLIDLYIHTDDGYVVDNKLRIVGVNFSDNSYISKKYYDEYVPASKKIYLLYINDNNTNNLLKSFNKMIYNSIDKDNIKPGVYYEYSIDATDSYELYNVIFYYNALLIYAVILSIVFTVFAFILFLNFIYVSITYSKKEIGILKALGTKNKDAISIFALESLLLAIISFIISNIILIILFAFLNNSYNEGLLYVIKRFMLNPLSVVSMLLFSVTISITITILAISRIINIKPIEAILDK